MINQTMNQPCFHRRQRQPHIVRGYFHGPHVRYTLEENPLSF